LSGRAAECLDPSPAIEQPDLSPAQLPIFDRASAGAPCNLSTRVELGKGIPMARRKLPVKVDLTAIVIAVIVELIRRFV